MDSGDPGERSGAHDDHGLETRTSAPMASIEPRPASEWSVNWAGAGVLVVLAVVALVAWRALGGADDDASSASSASSSDDVVETVATTAAPAPATTVTSVSTTAVPSTMAATTTAPPERQVLISAEMKPCRFGSNCLVASFTIQGFEQTSGQFFCIYPNSRREFSFQDGGKVDACLTADEGDTIVIEVDGVQSATVSEADLDGSP